MINTCSYGVHKNNGDLSYFSISPFLPFLLLVHHNIHTSTAHLYILNERRMILTPSRQKHFLYYTTLFIPTSLLPHISIEKRKVTQTLR